MSYWCVHASVKGIECFAGLYMYIRVLRKLNVILVCIPEC